MILGEYNAPTNGAGNVLLINDTSIPVITGGNPTTDVEVMVVQVNP